jgi:hypothetical protein
MNVIAQPIFFILFSFFTYACEEDLDVKNKESVQIVVDETELTDSKDIGLHNHKLWDELTKKYVTESGFVNYKGFVKDSIKLNSYIDLLSSNHPNDTWSSNERKAFWINAYNAFTIKLIVDNYPVKSIKDLGGSIYKVNTPWDIKFINIEGEEYDLNNIEHGILRDQWEDPRIHAAVNCASVSCPALMKGAFTADQLEKQLDIQMKRFILDKTKNTIAKNELKLSKIFKWFTGDFKNVAPDVITYINRFSDLQVSENAGIDYFEYDWNLNDVK